MSAHTAPLHLDIDEPGMHEGALRLSSRLRDDDGGQLAELHFDVGQEHAHLVGDANEAHVLGLVLLGMQHGRPLHIHGRVSPVLLRGLEEFMAFWALWRPSKLRAIRMSADVEGEPPQAIHPERAVAAFSGGLDSTYTLWRHTRGPPMRRRRRLEHAVLIRGLEQRLQRDQAWQRVCRDQRRTTASVGVELLPVTMNFVELYPGKRFFNAWGACVAACLALFQKTYGVGLLPAGANYGHLLMPQPTSPATDHLLSSARFRVIHDGAEEIRSCKSGALADWPQALASLRVCGRDEAGGNCGRCEKCVRTILGFRVLGLPVPEAFPGDLSLAQIRAAKVSTPGGAYSSESLLSVARSHGRDREPWARVVHGGLLAYRRRLRLRLLKDRIFAGAGVVGSRPTAELQAGHDSAVAER